VVESTDPVRQPPSKNTSVDQGHIDNENDPAAPEERGGDRLNLNALTVWAALTLGFLAYVVYGSISIHQWRWSYILEKPLEDIETVRLLDIWTHQASNLPARDVGSAMTGLYYVSVFVFIGGCILATWLLLSQAGERPQSDARRAIDASPEV